MCRNVNVVDSEEKLAPSLDAQPKSEKPLGTSGAYGLLFTSLYSLLIALMILVLNIVNTTGEYILGRVVTQAAETAIAEGSEATKATLIGKFYADFFSVVNVVSLLIQLFVVSRILKYLGVRVALLFLPVIALIGYGFAVNDRLKHRR